MKKYMTIAKAHALCFFYAEKFKTNCNPLLQNSKMDLGKFDSKASVNSHLYYNCKASSHFFNHNPLGRWKMRSQFPTEQRDLILKKP